MGNFFVDGDVRSQNNVSQVTIWFPAKQCAGVPGATFPDGYLGISQVGMSGGSFVEAYRDSCCAYFDPANPSYPTNQSTLDALAMQFEQDLTNWRMITFDYVFNGILNFAQSGLVDAYEFSYSSSREPCTTRIYTYPFNFRFHELGHFDVMNDCQNSTDTGQPNFDGSPYVYYYAPPATCVNGSLQLTRYKATIEDGRLIGQFVSTDTVASS